MAGHDYDSEPHLRTFWYICVWHTPRFFWSNQKRNMIHHPYVITTCGHQCRNDHGEIRLEKAAFFSLWKLFLGAKVYVKLPREHPAHEWWGDVLETSETFSLVKLQALNSWKQTSLFLSWHAKSMDSLEHLITIFEYNRCRGIGLR